MNLFRVIPAVLRMTILAGVCFLGAGVQAAAIPTCFVVDNSDPGFTASANWATGGSGGYGPNYRYRRTEPVNDPATWVAPVNLTGTYQISVWYAAGANRSTAARYILPNGSVVQINQQVNGGQWVTLGTVSLSNSNAPVKLTCWTTTGYIVIADAVRYCKL